MHPLEELQRKTSKVLDVVLITTLSVACLPTVGSGGPSPTGGSGSPSSTGGTWSSSSSAAQSAATSTTLSATSSSPAADAGHPNDAGVPGTGNLANLGSDWVQLPSSFLFLPNIDGEYQTRNWCTLRFNPDRKTLMFYEGFREPALRGNYCIYANALYEFDARTGIIEQRSLSNWYCDDTGGYRRIEDLPDTPVDRHTYSQFAYVPGNQGLYMVAGASARFPVADRAYDFWRYTHADGWVKLPESYPGSETDRAAQIGPYTANLIHHPGSNTLYYFKNAQTIHRYNVETRAWMTTLSNAPGSDTVSDIGAHGLYDPVFDRFAFYGNNWHPSDQGSNEFVIFDVATGSWQEQTVPAPPNGPGPKSYAALEYNSRWSVYMLHGGWQDNQTWVYDPASSQWHQVLTASAPPASTGRGTYTAYDAFNDALIKFDEATGRIFALRYQPRP